jgi:hypothetical protein
MAAILLQLARIQATIDCIFTYNFDVLLKEQNKKVDEDLLPGPKKAIVSV